MDDHAVQAVKRNYKRTKIIGLLLSATALASHGLVAIQIYQNPTKITLTLAAIGLAIELLIIGFVLGASSKRVSGISTSKGKS